MIKRDDTFPIQVQHPYSSFLQFPKPLKLVSKILIQYSHPILHVSITGLVALGDQMVVEWTPIVDTRKFALVKSAG